MDTDSMHGARSSRPTFRRLLAGVGIAGLVTCGGEPTSPLAPSIAPLPPPVAKATRDFRGVIDLPPPVVMDVSLFIRDLTSQSRRTTPAVWSSFITVPVLAQELELRPGVSRRVSGMYALSTSPVRRGAIEGTFSGTSVFGAGSFAGTLTETVDGCVAQREYSGPIGVAGLQLTAGTALQACPRDPLDLGFLKLESRSLPADAAIAADFTFECAPLFGDTQDCTFTSTSSPEYLVDENSYRWTVDGGAARVLGGQGTRQSSWRFSACRSGPRRATVTLEVDGQEVDPAAVTNTQTVCSR